MGRTQLASGGQLLAFDREIPNLHVQLALGELDYGIFPIRKGLFGPDFVESVRGHLLLEDLDGIALFLHLLSDRDDGQLLDNANGALWLEPDDAEALGVGKLDVEL